jgi:hypothetical protein
MGKQTPKAILEAWRKLILFFSAFDTIQLKEEIKIKKEKRMTNSW